MADTIAGLLLFVGLPTLAIIAITAIWELIWPEGRKDARRRNPRNQAHRL